MDRGRTLSVVGESGCGKTTAGKSVINLIRPSSCSVLLNTGRSCAGSDYLDIADLKKAARQRILLSGEVPSPMALPTGCRFRTRCPLARALCAEPEPGLTPRSEGHRVACHFR
jgi:oligopeptide/dipeptide ABC transporter ATP-binding protein